MLPLFEDRAFRAVTGDTIRPGGLLLTDRAIGFCRLPEGSRVLDVGCGVGATVSHLRREYRMNAWGLDMSAGFLKEFRNREPGAPMVRATASSLPIGDESLAAVFCECVLSLTSDPAKFVGEFYRVLKARGVLVLTDLYLRSPEGSTGLSRLPVSSCLAGAMSKPRIKDLIRGSGLNILVWEDHSELLKELAVRLIFAGSSLKGVWGGVCVRNAKPGYFLLIAEKGDPLCRTCCSR